MAVIKCKMCGGDIVVSLDKTCGTCDSCGSIMTFPRVSDEQQANLFNRANHFRRQNEFDKAVAAYERILDTDDTDAEAHWGTVISRYGIEYVENPATHERIPTCHRVQASSILTDVDYLAALEHAPDSYSRELYEKEATRIAETVKKSKTVTIIVISCIAIIIAIVALYLMVLKPEIERNSLYKEGQIAMASGDYTSAYAAFFG